jgi:RNA polymerase sigma-70 factor (ECF subfamily)
MIYEAETLLEAAIGRGQVGPYQVQAAIHGLHANARDAKQTDWQQIVGLYQLLMRMMPSDVVALNYAAAVSFAQDAQAGLELLTDLEPRMEGYQPYHAAKADMLARAGHAQAASASYDRAIALSGVQGERAFLLSRQSRLQARPN